MSGTPVAGLVLIYTRHEGVSFQLSTIRHGNHSRTHRNRWL